MTFENVQAGLRTDYLFRIANQRGGIVLGTGDLSELALGWATYGVGDQMSHYNVNGGVPEDVHPAPDPLGDRDRAVRGRGVGDARPRSSTPRSAPSSCPGEELQSTESQIGPYALHDFTLFYTLRYGFRPVEDRLPGAGTPGATRDAGDVAAGLPGRPSASPTTCRRSAAGSRSSASASSRSPSSSARRCRTGRRSRPAARCRRAATGGRRRTARPARGCATSSASTTRAAGADAAAGRCAPCRRGLRARRRVAPQPGRRVGRHLERRGGGAAGRRAGGRGGPRRLGGGARVRRAARAARGRCRPGRTAGAAGPGAQPAAPGSASVQRAGRRRGRGHRGDRLDERGGRGPAARRGADLVDPHAGPCGASPAARPWMGGADRGVARPGRLREVAPAARVGVPVHARRPRESATMRPVSSTFATLASRNLE